MKDDANPHVISVSLDVPEFLFIYPTAVALVIVLSL